MRKNSGFSGNFSIFYALHWISVVYFPARKLNQTFFSGGIQAEIAAFWQKIPQFPSSIPYTYNIKIKTKLGL